jgi:hypothetical protein
MNDRYQGDGPVGKTKRSATSAKPKKEAAASVHIEKKPETPQERKAARKRREAETRRKAEERARKAAQREKAALAAAGIEPAAPKKSGFLASITGMLPKRSAARDAVGAHAATGAGTTGQDAVGEGAAGDGASGRDSAGKGAAPAGQKSQALSSLPNPAKPGGKAAKAAAKPAPRPAAPAAAPTSATATGPNAQPNLSLPLVKTPQYKRLKRLHYTLLGCALVSIGLSFFLQMNGFQEQTIVTALLVIGYATAIGGIVLDFGKIRPLIKRQHAAAGSGRKSPKQLKHEMEANEQAKRLQEARDAEKASKRGGIRRLVKRDVTATASPATGASAHADDDAAEDAVSADAMTPAAAAGAGADADGDVPEDVAGADAMTPAEAAGAGADAGATAAGADAATGAGEDADEDAGESAADADAAASEETGEEQ